MTRQPESASRRSIKRHLFAGVGVVALLAGGVGGWAATTQIAGAVIAPAIVVIDTNVKKVQHPTGGIVGEIRARDGDQVRAGDIVLRLDETVTRANLAVVTKALNELTARKARLEGERDGVEAITFPPEFLEKMHNLDVARLMDSERKLFELRRSARVGQKAQLRERIAQLIEEIGGHTAQESAKSREVTLIQRELTGARELWEKNLMPITKLTLLEREATRVEGERAQLVATIAQVKGKIAETELQIIQLDKDLSSEVAREMREIDAKIGEFVERKVAAEDQFKRIDIRAPHDGFVHQSIAHTVGGVIAPGEQIMLIVPDADRLIIEAKVAPQDIDQLRLGQTAMLRFSALNQRSTPEISGFVSRISADTSTDQRTGISYYTLRIAIAPDEIARLGSVKLVPGMPVEAFVQTGERTVISYLVKPVTDQLARTFRER
jgi:HlyD family secretion protein